MIWTRWSEERRQRPEKYEKMLGSVGSNTMSRAGERVFYANMTLSAKQIDLEKTLFLSVVVSA